jgi:hypothetical protein
VLRTLSFPQIAEADCFPDHECLSKPMCFPPLDFILNDPVLRALAKSAPPLGP